MTARARRETKQVKRPRDVEKSPPKAAAKAPAKVSGALQKRLQTASGASAEVSGDLIVLRDRKGSVVVVFDAEKGSAEIMAPKGDLSLSAPAGRIVLRAPEVVCEAGKLEIHAERVIERAKDVYREIEGLLQTRSGRARQIVKDSYQVLAKRVQIAAEEDAALDGKRVLLG